MNSIARWRYARYASTVAGSGEASKTLERHGELDGKSVLVDRVLQVEEVDVAREVAEQSEEVRVQGERVARRAGLVEVVPADVLQRQIEPVLDLRWHPRLWLIVILPSTRLAGKTIIPPIV